MTTASPSSPSSPSSFDVVVAADRSRGIGKDGRIPWRLPGDVAHFKRLTTATDDPARRNAVIMGRATWDSIPDRFRPLPGRVNAVLSRRADLALPAGVRLFRGLPAALAALGGEREIERLFVIGGGMIYAEAIAMPACRRIYYTRIDAEYGCDTRFPAFEGAFAREAVLDEVAPGRAEAGVGANTTIAAGYRIEVWCRGG